MPAWTRNRYTGAKSIPPLVKASTERRILDYAAKNYAGKFSRIEVRFRGALCYIDAYIEPQAVTPTHLCRIRYLGNGERWEFAFYTYSHEKYEPSFLITGNFEGTPEEAFETSSVYL